MVEIEAILCIGHNYVEIAIVSLARLLHLDLINLMNINVLLTKVRLKASLQCAVCSVQCA